MILRIPSPAFLRRIRPLASFGMTIVAGGWMDTVILGNSSRGLLPDSRLKNVRAAPSSRTGAITAWVRAATNAGPS